MGLHHRKLLSDSVCENYCRSEQPCAADKDCVDACHREVCNNIPVPPPPPPPVDHTKHNNTSTYLITSFSIAATVFLVLFCYVIYDKFFSSSNRSRRRDSLTEDDFIDEEHGPTVDHPIWYIRTPGLQQSIINAITVCKYNKGDGLIEGTDCSVCLTEFQQDENLRLLPKCNHAFHLPCIDTWLTSHTNCPLCRAPIVTDPLRVPSMNPNVLGSSTFESARMEFSENSVANGEEEEGEEVEEDGRRVCEASESSALNMQPRRSVSLDSSSAAKINLALSTAVLSVESHHGNSDRQQVGEVSEQIVSKRVAGNGNLVNLLHSAPSSMKRSRSFNGKHLLSWYSRSQKKSNGPVRSF